jgi:hypothetical protein
VTVGESYSNPQDISDAARAEMEAEFAKAAAETKCPVHKRVATFYPAGAKATGTRLCCPRLAHILTPKFDEILSRYGFSKGSR